MLVGAICSKLANRQRATNRTNPGTRRDMATIAAMPRIVDVDFLEQFHYSMDKAGGAAVTEMKSLLIDCRPVSSETEEIIKCMDRALYYFNKFKDPPGAVSAMKQLFQANEINNGNGKHLEPHKLAACVHKVRAVVTYRVQWVSHPIGHEGPYKENLLRFWDVDISPEQMSYWIQTYRKLIYEPFLGRFVNIYRGEPRPRQSRPQRLRDHGALGGRDAS